MVTDGRPALPSAPFPLCQCTTFELSAYRAELEHEIAVVFPDAPAAADLRRLLDGVLAEEDQRRRIRNGS